MATKTIPVAFNSAFEVHNVTITGMSISEKRFEAKMEDGRIVVGHIAQWLHPSVLAVYLGGKVGAQFCKVWAKSPIMSETWLLCSIGPVEEAHE